MSLWRLVRKEIAFRKVSFLLGVLSVLVAVGCLVGELALLRSHDLQTERIIAAKQRATAERMDRLKDDYRKITLKLGFNVTILPAGVNLQDVYADDFATQYMPESYADRLAASGVATINHILPSLTQKLTREEMKGTFILTGVRDEIPIVHKDPKKPILQPVDRGEIILGHGLAARLGLEPGRTLTLFDRSFEVKKVYPPRGNKDDITAWMHLADAQELLDKPGQINAILALNCRCSSEQLANIPREIAAILPDTEVSVDLKLATARSEARETAAREAATAIAAETRSRQTLRRARESFAAVLVPVVLIGCIVWVGVLAYTNVRDRSGEIGILRALGLRGRDVFAVILTRAALIGLFGAVLGYVAGLGVAVFGGDLPASHETPAALFDLRLLLLALVASPILSAAAGWVPATLAAREDPAVVLREE